MDREPISVTHHVGQLNLYITITYKCYFVSIHNQNRDKAKTRYKNQ